MFRFSALSLALVFCASLQLSAEDASKVPAAAVLPGEVAFALNFPDLPAARKALAASDFGKLWAEPEMQLFIKPVWDELFERYAEMRKGLPIAPDLADVDKTFSGDVAVSVALPTVPGGMPEICVATRVGDAAAATRLLGPLAGGQALTDGQVLQVGGMPGGPALVYEKGLLLGAMNNAALTAMRARLADPAKRADGLLSAKGWTTTQKMLGASGHMSIYVDVTALIKAGLAQAPNEASKAKAKDVLAKLGADSVQALMLQAGSRGTHLALDAAVAVSGEPKGMVAAALGGAPLNSGALGMVPEAASFCSVSRFDGLRLFKLVRSLLDPEDAKDFERALAESRTALEVDIVADVLTPLGDVVVVYDVGGSELMGVLPSVALAWSLKDAAKASKTVEALLAKAEQELGGGPAFRPQVQFRQLKIANTTVHYLSVATLPMSPSIAVIKDQLLVTLSVNGMRRALAQLSAPKSVAHSPNFKEALERVTGQPLDLQALPGHFSYSSPPKGKAAFAALASLGQLVSGAFTMQLKMRGAWGGPLSTQEQLAAGLLEKIDFALFPSDEVFERYLRPTASALVKLKEGVVLRNDIGLPSSGAIGSGQGGIYGVAIVSAIAVPSLLRSRMAANQTAAAAGCKAFAEAQEIYRRTDYDQDGILEYAQSIRGGIQPKAEESAATPEPSAEDTAAFDKLKGSLSSEDFGEREKATQAITNLGAKVLKLLQKEATQSKDAEVRSRCQAIAEQLAASLVKTTGLDTRCGLVTLKEEGDLCLLDKTFGRAEGNPSDKPTPKAGYCFKLLTGQGPKAPGGKRSYLVPPTGEATKRNMTLGYAVVAYPAVWDSTGRDCFMINNNGTIYQKDLGADTHKIVEEMTEFEPDETWAISE